MISFNKEEHKYTVNGEECISVTTLIGSWFKKFDPKKALASIRAKPKPIYNGMTDDEILLKWETDGIEAARLGNELHEKIEHYLKGDLSMDYFKDRSATDVEYGYALQFMEDNRLVTKEVEWRVGNEELKIAGTIDYAAQNKDGTIDLYDWKRSSNVSSINDSEYVGYSIVPELSHIPDRCYWRYTIQLNLYKFLIEKKGYKVRRMYIVCFHPNNLGYQKYQVSDLDLENVLNRIRKV